MKKIYIIAQSYGENRGSFYGFVEGLARHAAGRGYAAVIICAKQDSKEPDLEKLKYATVYRFKLVRSKVFNTIVSEIQFAKKLKEFFRRHMTSEEDLIVANGYTPLGIPDKLYFLRSPDQPALTLLKDIDIAKEEVSILTRIARDIHYSLCYFIDRKVTKKAAGIIYSSRANMEECIKYYGVKSTPYFIPNKAIDMKEISDAKKIEFPGKTILFIARSDERIRKGVIHLEKALPDIFDRYPGLKVIHVGDKTTWNLPDKYKNRVISLGKIPQKEMRNYYKSVDMLAICSISEGIPAVLMEAIASGCPVITSDIEGADEYINHMKTGFIYKRGDVSGLKKGLIYMLENKRNAKMMAKKAMKKVSYLDKEDYFSELLKFCESERPTSRNLLEK